MIKDKLWTEKYRPRSIEQYTFQDADYKATFERMAREKDIPHLLLSGVQGTGKSSLAQILITACEVEDNEVLTINASKDNSVEIVRDKIHSFVSRMSMGPFRVVLLEEIDYFSTHGQKTLCSMMEMYADSARFIFTCNLVHRLLPELKSRCQHFHFKAFDKDDILETMAKMLIAETIKFNITDLEVYINAEYPDLRKIINVLQQNSSDGTLLKYHGNSDTNSNKFEFLDLLKKDKWDDIRKVLCNSMTTEEWESVFRLLYENLEKSPKFSNQESWEEGIVIIADHLYRHTMVSDPEINVSAMLIRLSMVK